MSAVTWQDARVTAPVQLHPPVVSIVGGPRKEGEKEKNKNRTNKTTKSRFSVMKYPCARLESLLAIMVRGATNVSGSLCLRDSLSPASFFFNKLSGTRLC